MRLAEVKMVTAVEGKMSPNVRWGNMVETLINLGGIEIFEQNGGNEIKVEFDVQKSEG